MDIVKASVQKSSGGRVARFPYTIVGEIVAESPAGLTIYGHRDGSDNDREFEFRRGEIRSVQRNVPAEA